MSALVLIATNAVRQIVRQRLFYNIVLFGIAMVLFAMVISNITFGYPDRVVRSIGLSGVSIALNLMALLLGTSLIHDEIDRKTLFVVLARPLRRWQYVTGRYLGLCMALAMMCVALSVVFAFVLTLVDGSITRGDLIVLGMALVEASVLGAVGVSLSCFTTPSLGVGMGLGVWIISASTDDLVRLTEGQGPAHTLARAVSYVFPSLARFDFREAVVYELSIPAAGVAFAILYGVLFCVALVALASIILQRREML